MRAMVFRNFLPAVFLLLFWSSAFAAAIVETVSGDVKVVAESAAPADATLGQRIQPGSTVTTGANGKVLLRFDDGQAVYLNADSEFRISSFRFERNRPQADNIVLDLLKGAMRSVSGLIGSRTPRAYALRVPQATIGIRGTDFMVALVNPLYLSVGNGLVAVANGAGAATFSAGSFATVASAAFGPVSITAAALPAQVASIFSQMSAVSIGAAGGVAGGAGGATSAGAGGISGGAIGAAAGAVAAALSQTGGDSQNTTSTGTTGTTGTSGTR